MILANVEIHRAIDEQRLVIKPEPVRAPSIGVHCPYDTHSVDLRLASTVSVPESGKYAIDLHGPGKVSQAIADHSKDEQLTENQPYLLKPGQFILGRTVEWVGLPIGDGETCLAARIEGKSSRARFGILVHFTAPTVHPGFEGTLTLEIANLGASPFLLIPDMYIAQLIIEEVKGRPNDDGSEFRGQTTPSGL